MTMLNPPGFVPWVAVAVVPVAASAVLAATSARVALAAVVAVAVPLALLTKNRLPQPLHFIMATIK